MEGEEGSDPRVGVLSFFLIRKLEPSIYYLFKKKSPDLMMNPIKYPEFIPKNINFSANPPKILKFKILNQKTVRAYVYMKYQRRTPSPPPLGLRPINGLSIAYACLYEPVHVIFFSTYCTCIKTFFKRACAAI